MFVRLLIIYWHLRRDLGVNKCRDLWIGCGGVDFGVIVMINWVGDEGDEEDSEDSEAGEFGGIVGRWEVVTDGDEDSFEEAVHGSGFHLVGTVEEFDECFDGVECVLCWFGVIVAVA